MGVLQILAAHLIIRLFLYNTLMNRSLNVVHFFNKKKKTNNLESAHGEHRKNLFSFRFLFLLVYLNSYSLRSHHTLSCINLEIRGQALSLLTFRCIDSFHLPVIISVTCYHLL